MQGHDVIRFMVGEVDPSPPNTQDIAAWRAYHLALLSAELEKAPARRPSEIVPTVLAGVRAEYLTRFPGSDAQANDTFNPVDPEQSQEQPSVEWFRPEVS